MKVLLKRGPLKDKAWYGLTRKAAKAKAKVISSLHGDCDCYHADGLIIIHAEQWYEQKGQRQ